MGVAFVAFMPLHRRFNPFFIGVQFVQFWPAGTPRASGAVCAGSVRVHGRPAAGTGTAFLWVSNM